MSDQQSAVSTRLQCPHCGSENLLYAEDLSTMYKIREIVSGVLRLEQDGETCELAFNERLICEDCDLESLLPPGMEVEICEE